MAEGVIKGAVLPATQTVVSGNIPEGAALAVARTTDRSTINFKNVATTIGFTLGEAATKVEFVAKGGENIAGTIDITYNGTDAPTYTVQEGQGSSKITLTDLAAGTYYFTILPDVTLSQGYELKINDYVVETGAVGTKLERSKIYSLGEVKRNVCEWGLVGQHQDWNLTEANITRLYEVVGVNNLWVAKGLKLSSTGFKFTELDNTNWDLTFGVHSSDYTYGSGWYAGIYSNNRDNKVNDIKVSDWNKTYDIYLRYVQNADWGKELGFAIVETGSAYPSF